MNIRRKVSFLFTVLLVIFPLVIILASHTYAEKARSVPLYVGSVTLILGILVLIGEAYPRVGRIFETDLFGVGERGSETDPGVAKVSDSGTSKRVLSGFFLMAGFFILVWLVGFLLAAPLFVFCFLRFFVRSRWVNTVLIALVAGGFVYVVFGYGMRLELFRGILFGEIAPPF